ncbi:MAG: ATP-binding protein [Planctomycetaceae bacterium]|nr:ATP-binding protein [Planctomycetaceae bacterium]
MSASQRVLVSWSSGKDSAWMLHVLQQSADIELVGLVTTFNSAVDRVAMHAVRRELVDLQAAAIGLPLWPVPLPWPCSNEIYEVCMRQLIEQAVDSGVTHFAFGDLFLEEIRDYRIRQLAGTGIEPLFPIWCGEQGTAALAQEMLAAGLQATLTCVDSQQLSPEFVGRAFDESLLADLPASVDPCGERGEFHTVCLAGPHQQATIPVMLGEQIERNGFVSIDVIPE